VVGRASILMLGFTASRSDPGCAGIVRREPLGPGIPSATVER
jgi:hypothetical protein